ncbi:hypothetical protein KZ779_24890 [Escherichia coli]|nr:hypothetical protein [Escherichia coli]
MPDATRNASYQAYSVQNPRADMAFTPHPTTGTNATIKKMALKVKYPTKSVK